MDTSAKEAALKCINNLSDTATFKEILDAIKLLQAEEMIKSLSDSDYSLFVKVVKRFAD